jgi:hypothetical protein
MMRWGGRSAAQWSRDATAPAAAGQRTVAHAAGSLEPMGTHVVAHLGASAQTGTVEHRAKGGLGRGRRVSTPHRSGHCDRNHAGALAPTRRYNSLRRQG